MTPTPAGTNSSAWLKLGVTLLGSAVITLVVTGLTMQWLLRRQKRES